MDVVTPPLALFLCLLLLPALVASTNQNFTFNGFGGDATKLLLDGMATVTPEGLLKLTNATQNLKGHAFYPTPISFRRSATGEVLSFSSTFVFAIRYTDMSGQGIAFVISPSVDFSMANGGQYMGVFNTSNNGNVTNHIVAVELDTVNNPEFEDIDTNHVGININGMKSVARKSAGYYREDNGLLQNLTLKSGDPMQVWVDYSAEAIQMNVTLSQFRSSKPTKPLISFPVNLSSNFSEADMYVGFSSSTGAFESTHYILGWSFQIAGEAKLNLFKLPSLPQPKHKNHVLAIWLPVASATTIIVVVGVGVFVVMRRVKFSEVREDWEQEYGPNRFSYKVLFDATNGFKTTNLLGSGGFGSVYKGTLPTSKAQVAVKRISQESRQGIKEFVAEIVSVGRLRHRNLVQLLGYCRRKRELLLVYDFMPNGSLDSLLFRETSVAALDWSRRLCIIKGVASGLQYLHEEWEQVVVHRDIKASNVLLDEDMNPRLGDFGLARLYDHGSDPQTTHVVGTVGYLAPELTKTWKATKATDVFAFGAFVLEVATGRRPTDPRLWEEEQILMDWVLEGWKRGDIVSAADPKMARSGDCGFVQAEVEMVLKLGLLCSHWSEAVRPNMRHVVRILNGDTPLPEMWPEFLDTGTLDSLAVASYVSSFDTECSIFMGQ